MSVKGTPPRPRPPAPKRPTTVDELPPYALAIDFSDVQCSLCKPITLGQCGHPFFFADYDWMQEQARQSMEEFGCKLANEHEKKVLSKILNDIKADNEMAAFDTKA